MQIMTENKLSPILRFSEFKSSYESEIFDDITAITRLAGYEYSEYWKEDDNEEIIALRGYNIAKGFLDLRKVSFITNKLSLQLKRSKLYKGDIVYPCVGSIGNAVVIEENDKYHIQQNIAKITCNESTSPYYIVQFLTSYYGEKQVYRFNASGAQPNVLVGSLRNYKINLPSLTEQKKVASFLSAVDEKLQQLTKKKELLSAYKKGVMQKIFSQELRFKDEFGNNYPDWEEKKLVEVFDFRRGKNISENKEGKQFLLGMGSVSEQGKLITKKRTNNNNHLLSKNDLVMPERDIGMGYIIGRVAIIDEDDRYVLGANILSLSPKDDILSHFIYYQINDNIFRKKMRRIINGSAQLMITSKDVIKLQLLLPVFDEQKKIANFLTSIDKKIELVSTQIENTKVFKKGLLQQMFV